jgi:hypothetical protein
MGWGLTKVYVETNECYYNSQVWFAKNILPGVTNDEAAWAFTYRKWLKEQGATIVPHVPQMLVNSLGVSPGYDKFGFDNEQDAVMFTLRWS